MFRPLSLSPLLFAALLAPGPAIAQSDASSAPQRVRSITLTQPSQACPASTDEEIIVCNRIDPNEQYRVPKELRNTQEVAAQNQSWVNRAGTIDDVSRVAGGLPNTCSPIGSGGFTGCNLALQRQYARDRKASERNDALTPGGGE